MYSTKLTSVWFLLWAGSIAAAPSFGDDFYCNGTDVLNNPAQVDTHCNWAASSQDNLNTSLRATAFGRALCHAEFAVTEGDAPAAIGLLTSGDQLPIIFEQKTPHMCLKGKRFPRLMSTLSCTATLVASDLIVTAAHCVDSENEPLYWYPKVWPLHAISSKQLYTGRRFKVVARAVIKTHAGKGDLALMQLVQHVTDVEPMAIGALPVKIANSRPKLDFFGHIKSSSLVRVGWSWMDSTPGPELLGNSVYANGGAGPLAQMFCASSDQADGASGGPFVFMNSIGQMTVQTVVGVLWGGPMDIKECGKSAPGQCVTTDYCLEPVGTDYYGDIATRTDILCREGVLKPEVRDKLTCVP
jgi:hypothetical protein